MAHIDRTTRRLYALIDAGFDMSSCVDRDEYGRFSSAIRVRCSRCEALVINGVACHETGCRNIRRDDSNDYFEGDE